MAAGAKDHTSALQTILDFLRSNGVPKIADQVKAVGHRVVHGLDISAPVLLTPNVVQQIKNAQVLAPLHNPPGLVGIAAAQEVFKGVPQVGCLRPDALTVCVHACLCVHVSVCVCARGMCAYARVCVRQTGTLTVLRAA